MTTTLKTTTNSNYIIHHNKVFVTRRQNHPLGEVDTFKIDGWEMTNTNRINFYVSGGSFLQTSTIKELYFTA